MLHASNGRGRLCGGDRVGEAEQEEAAHGRVTVAALCDGAVSAWSCGYAREDAP